MSMIRVTGYHGELALIPVDKIAFVAKYISQNLADPELKAGIKTLIYLTTSPSLTVKIKDTIEEIAERIKLATMPSLMPLPVLNAVPATKLTNDGD